jgi:hypothetical protein
VFIVRQFYFKVKQEKAEKALEIANLQSILVPLFPPPQYLASTVAVFEFVTPNGDVVNLSWAKDGENFFG